MQTGEALSVHLQAGVVYVSSNLSFILKFIQTSLTLVCSADPGYTLPLQTV